MPQRFPAPGSKKPAAAKGKTAILPEDESLKLPFEKQSWKDADEASSPDEASDQDGFVLGTDEEVESAASQEQADGDDELAEPEEEIEAEAEEEPQADEPDLVFADDDEAGETPPAPPRSPDHLIVRALLMFLVLVVSGYGLLTGALLVTPSLANRLLGPLPVIGTLSSDRLLARGVTLVGIEGKYQRIKDDSEVFVITGEVASTAPVTLHRVEVRGRLLSAGGEVVAEKTIYCGNVVSAKILGDLTPREVTVLQTIAPPKQFGIKPGERAPFVVVFMAPPKNGAEFTTQVIAASDQA